LVRALEGGDGKERGGGSKNDSDYEGSGEEVEGSDTRRAMLGEKVERKET